MAGFSLNNALVWQEISAIQQAILAAASQCQPGGGQTCTTVAGNTPMTFISGVASVAVNSGGIGYYTDVPSVKFIPPYNQVPTTLATATVTTNGGAIISLNMTNNGAGYQPVNSSITITSAAGLGAVIQPQVNAAGNIQSVTIVTPGAGYLTTDTLTAIRAVAPNSNYVDAKLIITSVDVNGGITGVAIIVNGTGYQPSVTTVEIVSNLNSNLLYPLGAGFAGTVYVDTTGIITGVTVTSSGAGYINYQPYLVINNAGSGAITSVSLNGTSVSSVTVLDSGNNYSLPISGTIYNPPTAYAPNPPAIPANVTVNLSTNSYGTNPNLYWQVWSGAVSNDSISRQMSAVLSYFTSIGYTIQIQSNPNTGSTIQWVICW